MSRNGSSRQAIRPALQTWAALCAGLLVAGQGLAATPSDDPVCTGAMANGWSFAAQSRDGLFDDLVWTRPGEPDQITELAYYSTNAEGQPVWRGTVAASAKVILVDLSGGSMRDGARVSVHAEDWGWAAGTCQGAAAQADDAEAVLRSLLGLRDTRATNWLRSNGFSLVRTVAHSGTGKTERWSQTGGPAVEIVFDMGLVSDVVSAAP